MDYIQIKVHTPNSIVQDILIAELSEYAEGFEELENGLIISISQEDYETNASIFAQIFDKYECLFSIQIEKEKNWNNVWESNFEPVLINDFCAIRATFHNAIPNVKHEIIITPKMSFGTGHHATTRLMIQAMKDINFQKAKVLDFGTGTGVLAILAEMLGAESVLAIDNDTWAFDNAIENVRINNCKHIQISITPIDDINEKYDCIIANINRNILLQYLQQLYKLIKSNGILLMSGLLTEDEDTIVQSAQTAGFKVLNVCCKDKWIAIKCKAE